MSSYKITIAPNMSLVDLGKRLLGAAKAGDTEEVRTLMSNGAPFTTDWLGTSPLHFASTSGHVATSEVLLRAGISRDARTKVDRTPLHVACQEGHLNLVELLLLNGADIEAKDMLKMTPLHWAVEKGNVPVIQALIKYGADASVKDKFDRTPLDIGLYNGRTDIVQILQAAPEVQQIETSVVETPILEYEDLAGQHDEDEAAVSALQQHHDGYPVTTVTLDAQGKLTPVSREQMRSDASNTNVLATLAALAEATAPSASHQGGSAADTLQWLETHGTHLMSGDSPSIITNSLDSGQTVALTDAGKLALNFVQKPDDSDEAPTPPAAESSLDHMGAEVHMAGDLGGIGEEEVEEVVLGGMDSQHHHTIMAHDEHSEGE